MKARRVLVNTKEAFEELLVQLRESEVISLDTETKALYKPRMLLEPCEPIVGFCVATREGEGFYIPIRHTEGVQLDAEYVIESLKPILADPTKKIGGHNIKYDLAMCLNEGMPFTPSWCSMLETHLCGDGLVANRGEGDAVVAGGDYTETQNAESLGLKELTEAFFNVKMKKLVPDLFKKKSDVAFATVDLKLATSYAASDPDWTLQLHNREKPRVRCDFLYNVELKLLPIVIKMEQLGITLDLEYMAQEAEKLEAASEDVRRQLMDYFSERLGYMVSINLGSTQQVADMLFDKLGIPVQAVSEKTKKPSTGSKVLAPIRDDYPVVHNLITYREIKKSAKDFYAKYATLVDENGRIHTDYGTIGASSGRFTSADPNCQNIAKKKEWFVLIMSSYGEYETAAEYKRFLLAQFGIDYEDGVDLRGLLPQYGVKELGEAEGKTWVLLRSGEVAYRVLTTPRKSFIPAKGKKLYEADYDQIESKILAAHAGEESLLVQFERMADIHSEVAAGLLGIPVERVGKAEREIGKALNHAIPYGMSEHGLSMRLGSSTAEAAEHLANYFKSRPAVRLYIDRTREKAKRSRKISTFFGRVQKVPEFYGEQTYNKQSKAERACVNREIQGTGADILKIAMVRADAVFRKRFGEAGAAMVQTNHDALSFEVDEDIPEGDVVKAIMDAMVFPIKGYPRITVSVKAGYNWGELEEIWGRQQWLDLYQLYPEEAASTRTSTSAVAAERVQAKPVAVREIVPDEDVEREENTTFVVESREGMITDQQAKKLLKLLIARPGTNTIVIKIGDYYKELTKYKTMLTLADKRMFDVVLSCEMFLDKKSVNVADVLKG